LHARWGDPAEFSRERSTLLHCRKVPCGLSMPQRHLRDFASLGQSQCMCGECASTNCRPGWMTRSAWRPPARAVFGAMSRAWGSRPARVGGPRGALDALILLDLRPVQGTARLSQRGCLRVGSVLLICNNLILIVHGRRGLFLWAMGCPFLSACLPPRSFLGERASLCWQRDRLCQWGGAASVCAHDRCTSMLCALEVVCRCEDRLCTSQH